MKRNYKDNPKHIFSLRLKMKKFIDLLNYAELFNEQIPYMVIHRGKNYYNSKLELNLTFKESIKNICISKNIDEANKQFSKYILEKLNNITNIVVKSSYNQVFLEVIEKSDENYYLSYMIAYTFELFNQLHNEKEKISDNCKLIVRLYNKNSPLFEIFGI